MDFEIKPEILISTESIMFSHNVRKIVDENYHEQISSELLQKLCITLCVLSMDTLIFTLTLQPLYPIHLKSAQ